eukprot:CAMPEP_0113659772 /NCGR_PEP_ID=MMETSP0017_2-20120614/32542_1 /TAXON_ID=2856 /ORGANISM="Cylindrotheca closterium" /LENGTH=297 /DNA_ID=CAMNT_0000574357 /DNA_START=46 /DNA_END=939 /DNA_ORIENTATION=+ /assembly_acc=CAM_ASM_000147
MKNNDDSTYRTIGHSLHALNLLNIALYGGLLHRYGKDDGGDIFDKAWLKEGFCLPDESTPFWTRHDLSGYLMVVMALLGLTIRHYLSNKNSTSTMILVSEQADQLTYWALLGALGHASGHFILSNAKRHKFLPPGDVTFLDDLKQSSFLVGLGKAGPGYPLFWIPLVKTYMRNTAGNRVALIALLFNLGSLIVPSRFGFSYAQAVLFGGMSIDQIFYVPQDQQNTLEYALWPLLTTLPNGAWAWFECMTCTTHPWMIQYGHILYDAYMVSSYTLFYLFFWWMEYRKQQVGLAAKKIM